eukprot:153977-Amphidinium_carterae.1
MLTALRENANLDGHAAAILLVLDSSHTRETRNHWTTKACEVVEVVDMFTLLVKMSPYAQASRMRSMLCMTAHCITYSWQTSLQMCWTRAKMGSELNLSCLVTQQLGTRRECAGFACRLVGVQKMDLAVRMMEQK